MENDQDGKIQARAAQEVADSRDKEPEGADYMVLINDEEQYSLWPAFKTIPRGWRDVGIKGKESDCVTWVDSVWTDITPKSVREALAARRAAKH